MPEDSKRWPSRLRLAIEHGFRDPEQNVNVSPNQDAKFQGTQGAGGGPPKGSWASMKSSESEMPKAAAIAPNFRGAACAGHAHHRKIGNADARFLGKLFLSE